jgi:ABC-2 type transport system permease protein
MTALAKRVIRQIAGDKRTVSLIVAAPMFILTLLYLLLGGTDYAPTIALDRNAAAPASVEALAEQDVNIVDISITGDFDPEEYLSENRDVDAVFSFSGTGTRITLYETGSKSAAALQAARGAAAALNPASGMETDFVIGSAGESTFDSLGYVFLGVIAFFLIFIVSGMALVRERAGGTLERMLMTPVTRRGVVAGYAMGYSLFAAAQAVILVLFSIYVLKAPCQGNVAWVALTMLMLAVSAVYFGQWISIFANTEFQVVQLIPVAIIPQIFFSGLIPLDTIPYHLGNLSYIMPIFYGCSAIREVMRAGGGIDVIWPYLLALLAYIAALNVLNTLALKKYRRL